MPLQGVLEACQHYRGSWLHFIGLVPKVGRMLVFGSSTRQHFRQLLHFPLLGFLIYGATNHSFKSHGRRHDCVGGGVVDTSQYGIPPSSESKRHFILLVYLFTEDNRQLQQTKSSVIIQLWQTEMIAWIDNEIVAIAATSRLCTFYATID